MLVETATQLNILVHTVKNEHTQPKRETISQSMLRPTNGDRRYKHNVVPLRWHLMIQKNFLSQASIRRFTEMGKTFSLIQMKINNFLHRRRHHCRHHQKSITRTPCRAEELKVRKLHEVKKKEKKNVLQTFCRNRMECVSARNTTSISLRRMKDSMRMHRLQQEMFHILCAANNE